MQGRCRNVALLTCPHVRLILHQGWRSFSHGGARQAAGSRGYVESTAGKWAFSQCAAKVIAKRHVTPAIRVLTFHLRNYLVIELIAVVAPAPDGGALDQGAYMGKRADFLVTFERDELVALQRFFSLFSSPGAFAVAPHSPELLSQALRAMQADISQACIDMGTDDAGDAGDLPVHLSLDEDEARAASQAFKKLKVSELEVAFGDEDGPTDASLALWKMLDVLGNDSFRL